MEHQAIKTSLTLSSKETKSSFILFQKSKYLFNSPSSFFGLGIGFFIYLVLAFWMRLKDIVYSRRSSSC